MMTNGKIGVALVGGYLLGRTKKAKMAIGLGMFLAGKKLNLDPKQLGQLVSNSPVLGSLNSQVRKELVDATKSAAVSAATNRMSGLADSLSERTRDLDDPDRGKGREERFDDEEDEGDDGEGGARESGADSRDSDEEPAPRRKAAARAPAKTATKSAKSAGSAGGKAASGAGRAASGAKSANSASRKTTSSAKKATSGAGRTATKATRAASNRGGRNA
ncbi:hypothetical protein [Streptomyces sp. NPDC048436]|uniref:hypothetical protein n=1 Tax=Streptomyces sp. NPDC048436 TaxID=3365550 RepID=UPI003718731F